jgi:hypothetical protein
MTTTLTAQEKTSLVNQAIKSVDYNIYSTELELIQLNAVSTSDPDQVAANEDKLAKLNIKRTALVAELESITE